MSQSNELEREGGNAGGGGPSRTWFDLGDGSEWVNGRIVEWRALIAYLFTIAALIFSETLGRLVSGLFALPQRGLDTLGDVYARLTALVVGNWPAVFSSAFDAAAASLPDLGVASFVVGIVFVAIWFVVINELVEVF